MSAHPVLLHLADNRRRPVNLHDVYLLEADDGDCLVRFRGRRRLRDVRTFGEVADLLAPYGFVRIQRGFAVNLRRVREIRPAADGGWEVRLDPPVNRVLPVSRRRAGELFAAYGEG